MLSKDLQSTLDAYIERKVDQRLDARVNELHSDPKFVRKVARSVTKRVQRQPDLQGPEDRLHVHPTVTIKNALVNTVSGRVTLEEHCFLGHSVKLLTGTHDWRRTREERREAVPESGRDIVVRAGAWIATGATVVGPCEIGEDAVIGAGAVVLADVAPRTVVGGNPARVIATIDGTEAAR